MKKLYSTILLLLLASCGTTRITAVGGKVDFGNDLTPVEEHTVAGFEVSSGPKGGGFGFEVGARFGRDSGAIGATEYEADSYEYYAGPRYEWRLEDWSPYVSLGTSLLHARTRSNVSGKFNDTDLGYYAAIGTDYHFGSGWHMGVSLRKTIDHNGFFLGKEGDADSWQYLLRFGYAF